MSIELVPVPTGTLEPSVPINESFKLLQALVQLAVQDKDLTAPPTTTDDDAGLCWIVGGSATGAWSGHDGDIALCTGANLWQFIDPQDGWRADVRDEDATYRYTGSAWVLFSEGGGSQSLTIVTEATAATITPGDHAGLNTYIRAAGDLTFDSSEGYSAGEVYNIRATAAIDLIGTGVTLTPEAGGTLALNAAMSVTVVMISSTAGDVIGHTVAA